MTSTFGPKLYPHLLGRPNGQDVLEALEGGPSGECCGGNGAQSDRQSDYSGFHADLLDLEALKGAFRLHARSSLRPPRPKTRKPTRHMVGRLHYSLRPTLSAHFRWGFSASERFRLSSLVREYYEVSGL
jgi:hypothetical protein